MLVRPRGDRLPEGPPLLLSEYPSPMIPYLSLLLALQGPALSQVNASHEHPPTDGLILWLDAGDPATLTLEDGRVAAWTSRAPGADVSLTSAGTQRPHLVATVGRGPAAAVAFDGRDDALRCLDFAKHARTWTLVAVIAPLRPARGGSLRDENVDEDLVHALDPARDACDEVLFASVLEHAG